ncbi:MAG: flagellar hook-associated protein FlgK, partial [Planctomycetota bacterium]
GALNTAQLGLQVAGNNIANANTPGYIRQQLDQVPTSATRLGNLLVGHGVRPLGVTQVIDQALAERMWAAGGAVAAADTLADAYGQLEQLVGGLDESSLSAELTRFNNALLDFSTAPGDPALRDLLLSTAASLTGRLNRQFNDAADLQTQWDNEILGISSNINRLTQEIAELNTQIATIEGGGSIPSDATGLRDRRLLAIEELATIVDLNVQEQTTGAISVFVAGDYLVQDGIARDLVARYNETAGGYQLLIADAGSPLQTSGGQLGAIQSARGNIFGDYLQDLNRTAAALTQTINTVHSSSQGVRGFQSLTGAVSVAPDVPLDTAGLDYSVNNGTFDIDLADANGATLGTHRIRVRNLGRVDDDNVRSIVSQINAIDGLQADVDVRGNIRITSANENVRFAFRDDTSGFLAAAGLNTFFTGTNASDIAVNPVLLENSTYLGISKHGVGRDTESLAEMLDLIDQPLEHLNGRSVRSLQSEATGRLAQTINLQRSAADGIRSYHETLKGQHLAVTGVNIDEESIRMLAYQYAFQASSRVISTATELLDVLVNL